MSKSAVIFLEIGDEGLPNVSPPNTIMLGPMGDGKLAHVNEAGDVIPLVDITHKHDDDYYPKSEIDTRIQNIESSTNSSIQVVDDRITNVDLALTQQIADLSSSTTQSINALSVDLNNNIAIAKSDVVAQIGVVNNRLTTVNTNLQDQIDNKKADFDENSAFNKNFGTTPDTVAAGDHTHTNPYTIQNLDGIDTMFITDGDRGAVSVESNVFTFAESKVSPFEWLKIGRATDTDSCFVMPHDGTIIGYSAQCENGRNQTATFDIYVDESTTSLFTFPSGNGNVESHTMDKNIQFTKGQKIRVRAGSMGDDIEDTVVNLIVKWRI